MKQLHEADLENLPPATIDYFTLRASVEKGVRNALAPWEVKEMKSFHTKSDEILNVLYEDTVQNTTDNIMNVIIDDIYLKTPRQ